MVDCLSISHYRALDMEDHTLPWNDTHTINLEHSYCYCGQDRNLLEIALQCRCKFSIDTNLWSGSINNTNRLPQLVPC